MPGLSLAPGTIFASDYQIERPLSEGGMGAVYVARQLSTGAPRALKLMHPQLVRDPSLRARFEQEAKVAAEIPSDHVVQVIAAGVDAESGMPWLAMELLDGTDLVEATATGRCDASRLRQIMEQLCHGLQAAHERGIVHRDLKPENVFLAAPRRPGIPFTVKILDFGIAKVTEQARATAATAAIGTPLWMAPEQAGATAGAISPATDVWALGLIAFWLLTGRSYWRGATLEGITLQALMREVLFDPLPPASERAAEFGVRGDLPAGFDAWFGRTVVREPAERHPDARTAFEALAHALTAPPSSGREFADASTAVADAPEADDPGRRSVPKTMDDVPPLRLDTPAWAARSPSPSWTERPSAPEAHAAPVAPAFTAGTPHGFAAHTPHGHAMTPATPATPARSGSVLTWTAATVIVLIVGFVATLLITREDWQPHLEAALSRDAPGTAVPAAPLPTASPPLVCPPGTREKRGACEKIIDRNCPSGMKFETGRGCVAIVAQDHDAGVPTTQMKPSKQTGTLSVNCQPACESVTVNGVNRGASPLVNLVLPAGTATIVLRRTGYLTSSTSTTIRAGQKTLRVYKLIKSSTSTTTTK